MLIDIGRKPSQVISVIDYLKNINRWLTLWRDPGRDPAFWSLPDIDTSPKTAARAEPTFAHQLATRHLLNVKEFCKLRRISFAPPHSSYMSVYGLL